MKLPSVLSCLLAAGLTTVSAKSCPAPGPDGCRPTKCLREMKKASNIDVARDFCATFVSIPEYDDVLPDFVAKCDKKPARISSACSCIDISTSANPTSTSSSYSSVSSTTSSTPSSSSEPSGLSSSSSTSSSSTSSSSTSSSSTTSAPPSCVTTLRNEDFAEPSTPPETVPGWALSCLSFTVCGVVEDPSLVPFFGRVDGDAHFLEGDSSLIQPDQTNVNLCPAGEGNVYVVHMIFTIRPIEGTAGSVSGILQWTNELNTVVSSQSFGPLSNLDAPFHVTLALPQARSSVGGIHGMFINIQPSGGATAIVDQIYIDIQATVG